MNNLANTVINRHLDIIRYLLVGAVIVLLTWIYPRNNFKFDYEKDKPWLHETLYAPFSFSIKKPAEQFLSEQEEAKKSVLPYYDFDPEVIVTVQEDFKAKLGSAVQEYNRVIADDTSLVDVVDSLLIDETSYLLKGQEILDHIYEVGILERDEAHQTLEAEELINILTDKSFASLKTIGGFYSLPSAYQYIVDEVSQEDEIRNAFLVGLVENVIRPNIKHNESITEKFRQEALKAILPTKGVIQEAEKIIDQGTKVTEEKFQILNSLRDEYQKGEETFASWYKTIGYLLMTSLILLIFLTYIRSSQPRVYSSLRRMTFILVVILIFQYMISLLVGSTAAADRTILYVVPFCMVPIIFRTFFGVRMALYGHMINVMIATFILPLGSDYFILQLLVGFVAILANRKAFYWSQFFRATLYVFIAYCLGYLAIFLIREGSPTELKFLPFGWLTVNAFLVLLTFPLIPFFEKLFGFVSHITLVELSDLNNPLLKELSVKAPGTFWHSIQVANLAEAAAYEVGADTLITKVGALYHDVGKMNNPMYFIENQKSQINLHDGLGYTESAKIIIGHVIDGIETAKNQGLPNDIVDFVRTHHGTTLTDYFYRKEVAANPDKEIDPKLFQYPGPIPYSKETALVMIADSLEAASRSLTNPTQDDIDNLVDGIIQHKIKQHQFENCDLSFKDLKLIRKKFKHLLKSNFHVRVKYPGLN